MERAYVFYYNYSDRHLTIVAASIEGGGAAIQKYPITERSTSIVGTGISAVLGECEAADSGRAMAYGICPCN